MAESLEATGRSEEALAEYRAGNWQAAIDLIEKTLPSFSNNPTGELDSAEGRLFQAMAYHKLGKDAEARKMLAEAERLLDVFGKREDEPTASSWHEQLFAIFHIEVHRSQC